MTKSISERLAELAQLYDDRHRVYGDTQDRVGEVMMALFPGGVDIGDAEDWNRFALLMHVINKLMRYASSFSAGGHPDSLNDMALYAMMLAKLDDKAWKKNRK